MGIKYIVNNELVSVMSTLSIVKESKKSKVIVEHWLL